jgi:FkbM family methyltransferase
VIKINENYWMMHVRHWASRRWRANRRRTSETIISFRRLVRSLPRNSLIVDCGANVGDVTDVFLASGHRVIAFEPDPDAFSRLFNRFGNNKAVALRNEAVGSSERRIKLHRSPAVRHGNIAHTQGTSIFSHSAFYDDEGIEVNVIDLPFFLKGLNEPIALLKLDIEGAELEIIETLLIDGHDHIGYILVETHERMFPMMLDRFIRIRTQIESMGLKKFNLDWV